MRLRVLLVGAALLLSGCIYHHKAATYNFTGGDRTVQVGNRKIWFDLRPTAQISYRDASTFPGRVAPAVYNSYHAHGPYSLFVYVTTNGIDNGVAVEITSAKLRFDSGKTLAILSKQEPPRKDVTRQQLGDGKRRPADTYSHCAFTFPLGDKLVFKADERVRVVATVKISGQPQEANVDLEFKGSYVDQWGSTVSQM